MNESNTLKWARYYVKRGWSVIPISPGNKIPPKGFSPIPYRERYATDEELKSWFSDGTANIGIVTGKLSNLLVIDFDKAKPEYNETIALEYFGDNPHVPIASTPSGGQHNYYLFHDGFTIGAGVLPAIDYRGEGGYVLAPPSVNGNGRGYKWLTSLSEYAPAPLPVAIVRSIKNALNNKSTLYKETNNTNQQSKQFQQFLQKGTRDNDVFHVLHCLAKGGLEKEKAYIIAEIIADSCNPPFSKSEAKAKVESAYDRKSRSTRNITDELREYINQQETNINLTEAYETLQFQQANEKATCQIAMMRFCKEGILEKISRGTYRKIQTDCQDIDIFNADTTPLDIEYPLGISDFVLTYPKNIIVIAGEPDAGKTAYLLNFALKNMEKHEVTYFSSEMGGIELRSRLKKFGLPMDTWKRISWKERASDFAPMIRPNGVNIIDFLEMHDEFYKVGLFIKQVFDRLNKGIAVIALQKPKGRDEGLGGQRGLEKPRLYLAMSDGHIKIVKAKNWRNDMLNPNGMSLHWKLAAGCKFKRDGDWQR